jgi:hypothetical protein
MGLLAMTIYFGKSAVRSFFIRHASTFGGLLTVLIRPKVKPGKRYFSTKWQIPIRVERQEAIPDATG